MNVELRRLKSYPRLSKETTAFNAELWINGVKAADVENKGSGGPNLFRFSDRSVEQSFYAYCKALPDHPTKYGPLKMDSDLLISLLVEKLEQKAWFARQAAKKVLFKLPGDKDGQFRSFAFPKGQREDYLAHVRKTYPTATIYSSQGDELTQQPAIQSTLTGANTIVVGARFQAETS